MKRILVAEDDPGMQDAIRLIFTRAGYDVNIIDDGDLLLKAGYANPDVFILDKQLSGVDGLDVCRFLKQQESTKDIPVIMLSANPHIGVLSKEAGADNFLEKPFRVRLLLEMVSTYT